MIIFQLKGGMANQMFIYAAARSFSKVRSEPIRFEYVSPYKYIQGYYSLNLFEASLDFASASELRKVKPKVKFERVFYELMGWNTAPYLVNEETEFAFNPWFYSIPDGSFVTGFWQAAKYSSLAEQEIRNDFRFRAKPDEKNEEVIKKMQDVNSVALHVRRGDYASIPETNSIHGVCSVDYFETGMNYIEERVKDPVYFIFSDDLDWARKNIKTPHEHHVVDINTGQASHEDMRLMSLCKHNIIANSSFSWWGAWLNENPDKIVIAPRKWMANPAIDTSGLTPESWIRL